MENNLRELTKDEADIFISIHGASENETSELFEAIIKEGGWVLEAIQKRFVAHSLEVDKKTMILILSLGDGLIGKCANYVDDISNICREKNIMKLDLQSFSRKIYPWGIPSF